MRRVGTILGVIIGAVFLLSACERQRAEMSFEKLDPDFSAIKSEYGFGYRWSD